MMSELNKAVRLRSMSIGKVFRIVGEQPKMQAIWKAYIYHCIANRNDFSSNIQKFDPDQTKVYYSDCT